MFRSLRISITRLPRLAILVPIIPLVSIFLLIQAPSNLTLLWEFTPYLVLAKYFGIIGASIFAINFFFSSRSILVEKWFGGLDNVYRLHRWTGYIAWILLLCHITSLVLYSWPTPILRDMILIPGRYWPYTFGFTALLIMDILVIATLIPKIPYHWWRRTHTFMSIALLFAILHVATVPSDVKIYMPLRMWMLALFTLASLSYFNRKVLYEYFSKKYTYTVERIDIRGSIIDLWLKADQEPMQFHPGQFAFMELSGHKLVWTEDHPFSFASYPGKPLLRLGIKQVGDYTKKLINLNPGELIKLQGPYGHFAEKMLVTDKDMIWVAGGIGVTPFLSMLEWVNKQKSSRKTHFFYTCRTKAEAVYHKDIDAQINKKMPDIIYSPWYTDTQGRLSAKDIVAKVGDLKGKLIFLCGPLPMMYDLADQFKKLGVRNTQIIFEDFSFK